MASSNKNGKDGRFSDVHLSEKNGFKRWLGSRYGRQRTVNLRPSIYRRYPVVIIFIFILTALSVFGARKLFTRAEVADFYPSNCLGSWLGPQNAQGKPEMLVPPAAGLASASTTFTENNSAVFFAGNGKIFCGNFLPENYSSDGEIKSVGLTFVWQVGEPSPTSSFPQTMATSDNRQAINTTNASATIATSTEKQGTSTNEATSNKEQRTQIPPPAAATSSEKQNIQPVNETSTTSFLRNFPNLLFNITFAQTASGAVPVASDVTTTAASPKLPTQAFRKDETAPTGTEQRATSGTQQTTNTETSSAMSAVSSTAESSTIIIGPPLQAALVPLATTSGAQQATSGKWRTVGAIDASGTAPTAMPVLTPPAPDKNFLKVSYSTDGQTWVEIAKVDENNWQNFTVTLPIASWDSLKKLQIQIAGIETTLNPTPKVYLDGMFAEVHYEIPPAFTGVFSSAASPNAATSTGNSVVVPETPVVVLPPSQKPTPVNPQQNTFKAGEAPQFNLDLNLLGAPTLASSTR